MNNLLKLRLKSALSIVVKLFILFGPISLFLYTLATDSFGLSIMTAFFFSTSIVTLISKAGQYIHILNMKLYKSRDYGYIFFRISEHNDTLYFNFYKQNILGWDELFYITGDNLSIELMEKKINKELDKYYTNKKKKEEKAQKKISDRKKAETLLLNRDNKDNFLEELKKLENE